MNTQKFLLVLSMSLLVITCDSDDDNGDQQQLPTEVLLVSGKWYFESRTPGSYTDCEKTGYVQFMENGTFMLENFEDDADTCMSNGVFTGSYTLTNGVNLTLIAGTESQSAVINSITQTELKITNASDGEQIVFDKSEG